MSQAGEEDDDLDRKFQTTDMREWTFCCPACGERQPFKWENVEWAKDCKDADEQYDFGRVSCYTDSEVLTFEEAGLLTRNRGLVVRTPDGSEFQLTIVKSE